MPYIDKHRRIDVLNEERAAGPGELNFQITNLVDDYMYEFGLSYTTINEVIGVLECAKLELYRRIAAPYEDGKMAENGDVYTVNTEG